MYGCRDPANQARSSTTTRSPGGQVPAPRVTWIAPCSFMSRRASGRSAVARSPTTMPLPGCARYPMERDRSPDLARALLLLPRPVATGTSTIGRQVQVPSGTRKIGDLRNRNPVQIPLRGATIERVFIGGRAERYEPALDSTPAGQAGDFFAGAKPVLRNMGQSLAGRQPKIESLGRRIVRQQRSPSSPTDLSIAAEVDRRLSVER